MALDWRLDKIEQQLDAIPDAMPVESSEDESPLWVPFGGPQTHAYHSEINEVLYGGAAGGGKSDLLLGLAIMKHRRSIIYRRETTQAKGIIDRSRELLQGKLGWSYNANAHTWTGPGGKIIVFAGVQHEWDWTRHQGVPYDFIGWDEAAHFTSLQFRVLNGWCRTADPAQKCRIVAASNPPTSAEGQWLRAEFGPWLDHQHPSPAAPGEARWYAMLGDQLTWLESGETFTYNGEQITPRSRTFYPARVEHNPAYMATGYMATLQSLPEPFRSQFLYGNFDAGLEDSAWQVFPSDWVRRAMARWRSERPRIMHQGRAIPHPMTCIGCDPARGGADRTVIAVRYGNWFDKLIKVPGRETRDGPAVAALVLKALGSAQDVGINVDVVGIGSSVFDFLRANLDKGVHVRPINNAASSEFYDKSNQIHLANLRAASHWRLRESLDPLSGEDLALPDDPELFQDLCATRFRLQTNGLMLESKDDVRVRLGRSPDTADAVVLAHWLRSSSGYHAPELAPRVAAESSRDDDGRDNQASRGTYGRGTMFTYRQREWRNKWREEWHRR